MGKKKTAQIPFDERDILKFKISLSMSKYEIKDYLTKIYGIEVLDVSTKIFKARRQMNPRTGKIVLKNPEWKLAVVRVDPSKARDVGF